MMQLVYSILIGAASGALAALFGVGGGIIMVPAFVLMLGLQQKQAAATSLAVIIFTSIAASVKNTTNSLIDWRLVAVTALSSAVVAWFAAGWLNTLRNDVLSRAFGVLSIIVGVYMIAKQP